jgi:hypothetical protein
MPPVSAGQMRAQLETIANKLSAGYTDSEIIHDLKLKRATYYNYKARITQIFGNLAMRKTEENLETELELLKDRYIRLYRNLEARLYNKEEELEDVAYATDIAQNIATNILRLEVEGLKARQQRGLRLIEQKAIGYLRDSIDKPTQSPIPDTSASEFTDRQPELPESEPQPTEPQPISSASTEEKVF